MQRYIKYSKYSISQVTHLFTILPSFLFTFLRISIRTNTTDLSIAMYFRHKYDLYFYANSYRYERN